MDAGIDGVDAELRRGAVGAFSRQGDAEAVHRGHGIGAVHDGACRKRGGHMHGKGRIHMGIFQDAAADGCAGAGKDFLAGLE